GFTMGAGPTRRNGGLRSRGGIRPAGCLDRRGYCQGGGRPPCRTLGRLTRRGDKSRIEERPANVWRLLHWLTFRPQGYDRESDDNSDRNLNESVKRDAPRRIRSRN